MRLFVWFGVFALVLVIIAAPSSVRAENGSTASIVTVNAVVLPRIYIVVNRVGDINEIYSNTKTYVEPAVVLDRVDGQPSKYTKEIAAKYLKLKPDLNYKQGPGVLYKYKPAPKPKRLTTTSSIVSVALRPMTGLPF